MMYIYPKEMDVIHRNICTKRVMFVLCFFGSFKAKFLISFRFSIDRSTCLRGTNDNRVSNLAGIQT